MQHLGILLFADRLPPLIGGMEMHAKYFIEYFTNHPRFPIIGVVTKSTTSQDCIVLRTKIKPIDINSLFKLFNPEIIFFNSGRWIEEMQQLRNIFPDAKFIYRTGGNEILKAPLVKKEILDHLARQDYWINTLNTTIDLLITNSLYTETRLNQIGIICPLKRFVGGVNIVALQNTKILQNTELTIFCAARFVPYKNHELMISLIHALVLKGYDLKVRLAGDGPLKEKIKKLVMDKSLEQTVKFLGTLDNTKTCQEIMNASIYMQLSCDQITEVPGGSYIHSEGMGRSILESLAAGTFVIAGNSGALPEIMTPEQGLLVDLDNFETMLSQIEEILKSPPARRPLSNKYGWVKIFKEYENLFKSII